ncbi:hypothetical protein [Streptomyces parvulus]
MPTFSHGRRAAGTPLPTEPDSIPTPPDTTPETPDTAPTVRPLAHVALSVGTGGGKAVALRVLREQINAGATVWGRSA